MRITFLGTAAATACPLVFCRCRACQSAWALGGRDMRRRSSVLIGDDLLIDLGPDLMSAAFAFGVDVSRVRWWLQTHSHSDHFDAGHLITRIADYATEATLPLEVCASPETLTHMSERLAREEWGAAGPSRIELMYRPGAGMSARPLRRIASGGEISRVMLAAKVVLGEADNVDTLVFDEVDAGVGGATAVALAQVIADLARTHQVIVVTHLAQVAVVGERHYVVRRMGGDVPETQLCLVEGKERVREVARMLSGDATEASLAHAREMLAASAG